MQHGRRQVKGMERARRRPRRTMAERHDASAASRVQHWEPRAEQRRVEKERPRGRRIADDPDKAWVGVVLLGEQTARLACDRHNALRRTASVDAPSYTSIKRPRA